MIRFFSYTKVGKFNGKFNEKRDLINKYDFKISYATMKPTNTGKLS